MDDTEDFTSDEELAEKLRDKRVPLLERIYIRCEWLHQYWSIRGRASMSELYMLAMENLKERIYNGETCDLEKDGNDGNW